MEEAVIIEGLTKQYRLGVINHGRLYKDLQSFFAKIRGKTDPNLSLDKLHLAEQEGIFTALDDVSFSINEGDRLGVIGRNGAGKSTLLKILSRITYPTKGQIKVRGKIASLLEVGTGFHQELTGRENIYLNGTILGMKKREIDKKLDEIVSFAGVEKFLDTPVKRYSSGMFVRLGFAVAAHLDSDILIVDEVLAVGDYEFQKKCITKMNSISQTDGRTVIFVSHNMNTVEKLCESCVYLNKGKLELYSRDTKNVINQYMHENFISRSDTIWENSGNEFVNDYFIPTKFYITDSKNRVITGGIGIDEDLFVTIEGEVKNCDPNLTIAYSLFDRDMVSVYRSVCFDDFDETKWIKFKKGKNIIKTRIPKHFLNEDEYYLRLDFSLHKIKWLVDLDAAPLIFVEITGGKNVSTFLTGRSGGPISPIMDWTIEN